jgi:hypothetical protein
MRERNRLAEVCTAIGLLILILCFLNWRASQKDTDPLRTLHDKIMACINYPRAC